MLRAKQPGNVAVERVIKRRGPRVKMPRQQGHFSENATFEGVPYLPAFRGFLNRYAATGGDTVISHKQIRARVTLI